MTLNITNKESKDKMVDALLKNIMKGKNIKDKVKKKMIDKSILLVFIDSEFSTKTHETYCSCALLVLYDNVKMSKSINPLEIIGEIKCEGLLDFARVHEKAKFIGVDEVHFIAHFNIVDITRIAWGIDVPIQIKEIQKGALISFEYDGIKYKTRDTMWYSQSGLEKIIKSFEIKDNSKEFLKDLAIKHGIIKDVNEDARKYMDQLWQVDKEGVMNYCLMDCYATYEFVKKLDEMVRAITLHECGMEITIVPFITIGSFNEVYQLLKARKQGYKTFVDLNEKEDVEAWEELIMHMIESYKGGGIIMNNIVGLIKFNHNKQDECKLYAWHVDVTSLYPISAMLIPNLSLSLKKWRSIEEEVDVTLDVIIERVQDLQRRGAKEAFLYLNGEMPTYEWHPFLKKLDFVSGRDEEENSSSISLKCFDTYVSIKEFNSIVKWLEAKGINAKDVKINKFGGKYTRDEDVNWLRHNFISLLRSKEQFDREGKQALKEVYKLLMNGAYGKLAQRIDVEYANNKDALLISIINDPILVAFLTSYSRALMVDLMRIVHKHNGIVVHMAQDSMIIISDDARCMKNIINDQDYLEVQDTIRRMGVESYEYLKIEVDTNKEHKEIGEVQELLIFRDKLYCWYGSKGIKEAHHAIHLPKDKNEVERWWRTMKECIEQGVVMQSLVEREGWIKLDDYLRHRERLLGISKEEPIMLSELVIRTKTLRHEPIYDNKGNTKIIINKDGCIKEDELSLYMPYIESSHAIISRSKKIKYDALHPCNPFQVYECMDEIRSNLYDKVFNNKEEYLENKTIMERISNDVRMTLRGKKKSINEKRLIQCKNLGWVYMTKFIENKMSNIMKTKRLIRQGNKVKRAFMNETKERDEQENKIMEIINEKYKDEIKGVKINDIVQMLKQYHNIEIVNERLGRLLDKYGWRKKKIHGFYIRIPPCANKYTNKL